MSHRRFDWQILYTDLDKSLALSKLNEDFHYSQTSRNYRKKEGELCVNYK